MDRECENCSRILHGRTDQRFCNDTCRNSFNRTKRKQEQLEQYNNMPEIFKIIKQNHELLASYKAPEERHSEIILSKSELLSKGFNFKYFTSIHKDLFGRYWNCCFEQGYLVKNDMVSLHVFKEQITIEIKE